MTLAKSSARTLKVTLVRSPIGTQQAHRACVRGLGLRKIRQTVELADTPATRGMINAVSYLVKCEEESPRK
jgi:large subunit ribosomal protein L30